MFFKKGVIALNGDHAIIQEFADLGLLGLSAQERPAGFLRNPEDIFRQVFVAVFGVGVLFQQQLGMNFFERIGNIFQKDQAEHDMLVFRSIHVAAQLVRRCPELALKVESCAVVFVG
jgi:hypothetical protein